MLDSGKIDDADPRQSLRRFGFTEFHARIVVRAQLERLRALDIAPPSKLVRSEAAADPLSGPRVHQVIATSVGAGAGTRCYRLGIQRFKVARAAEPGTVADFPHAIGCTVVAKCVVEP